MRTRTARWWWVALGLVASLAATAADLTTDLCVYGGTAGGVACAVQGTRQGLKVVLVEPTQHLGGLTTGGLGATDVGAGRSIGGMAREFYTKVREYYETTYGAASKQAADCHGGYRFEPSVAEKLIDGWLDGTGATVVRGARLTGVAKTGNRLTRADFADGTRVSAKVFVDTTYEGDLMAAAGVAYRVGREANTVYGETLDGRQFQNNHNFRVPIDPYIEPGKPESGLLWGISPEPPGTAGEGDRSVQAYNFRMCLTKAADRLPIAKPDGYDPARYELLLRYLQAGVWDALRLTSLMPNGKTDTNNFGGFSTDYIGGNHAYPEADQAARERIIADHRCYQQGMMYFLANDERVPEAVRREVSAWGLPRDEFADNGGWARQLYVREARRMIGAYVMTEANCRGKIVAADSIGLASYGMDSHNCRRVVIDGRVRNEGNVEVGVAGPYPIGYGAITPREEQCANLLVPVCLSASHIAYGSIRMEPVFMITGQSAAVAAALAIGAGRNVQNIDRAALRERLVEGQQVLEWVPGPADESATRASAIDPKSLPGITLDDVEAKRQGPWVASTVAGNRLVGTGYLHDGNEHKGEVSITWVTKLPQAGTYQVVVLAPYNGNRAARVPVTVSVDDKPLAVVMLNMRDAAAEGRLVAGTWKFEAGAVVSVTVSNRDTDGYVVADGLAFLPHNGG